MLKWGFVPLRQGWCGRRCCPYLKIGRKISCGCWLFMGAFPFLVFCPSELLNSCWEGGFSIGKSWKIVHSQLFLVSWKLWCGLSFPVLQNGEWRRCLTIYFLFIFACWESRDDFGSFSYQQTFAEDIRGVTLKSWWNIDKLKKSERKQWQNFNISLKHAFIWD